MLEEIASSLRWISPSGSALGAVANGIEHIRLSNDIDDIHRTNESMFYAIQQQRRLGVMPPPQPSQAQPPFSDAAINEEADIGPPRPTRRQPRAHNFTAHRQTVSINRVESTCLPVPYHDQQTYGHTVPPIGSIPSPSQAGTSEMPGPSYTMTSYSPYMI